LVEEESAEPTVSYTIYVKNLNFITTEQELQRVFSKHVKTIRAVKIPTKAALVKKVRGDGIVDGNQVNHLSMAFGFVECDSEESVRKAIKALQGTIVDGHALELKCSSKAAASSVPKKSQGSNPIKPMVRNVPFQATRKELLHVFHRACIAFRMMRWPLFLFATCALFFQIVWLLYWYPQSDNFLYSSFTMNNEWNCDNDAAPLCNMTTTP
jgi:RNA recognition motif-containing protein